MPTIEAPLSPGMVVVTTAGEALTLLHDPRSNPTDGASHEAQLQSPSGTLTTHSCSWDGQRLVTTIPGANLGTNGIHFVRCREVGNSWPDDAIEVFVTGGTQPQPPSHSHVIADTTGLSADLASRELAANKDAANGYAGLGATGLVSTSALGTGTANSSTYLRGDRTWAAPPGGGSSSAATVEVNLGGLAFRGKFTITDAAITASSKVLCWQAPGPYTGKGTRADEAELQPVQIIAVEPATGSAVVKWQTPPIVIHAPVATRSPILGSGSIAANGTNRDLRFVATRIGKVRGNVKFSYTVFS